MTFTGVGDRLPIARRRISPIWLVVGAITLLASCCCTGLLIHTAGFDGSGGSKSSPTPNGGTGAPLVPAGTPAVAGTPAPTAASGPHAVPSVIGLRLPDAERRLKAAGFSKMHVTDVSGKGRIVIDPTNWVVRVQEPAVGARVVAATRITLRVGKPTDLLTTAAAVTGVIPNVVCRDLQTAQDALRDAGYYVLTSKDGTGQDRRQILDRNWVVIAQSAAAGARPRLSTRITLTVVKFGEPATRCPT
jgi:beta-lactam-binding protein with PASTA domain